MATAKCRNCDRSANAGAYCGYCAASIMAKALDPFFGGKRNKLGRPGEVRTPRPSAQQRQLRLQF